MKNRMKKSIAFLLLLIMMLTSVPLAGLAGIDLSTVENPFSTTAQALYAGDIRYRIIDNQAVITGLSPSFSGNLVIPSKIGIYPVVSIYAWAFKYCTGLTGVTIPNSVIWIDDGAFEGCTNLKSITIPGTVKYIDTFAFFECTGLETVTICDGVEGIGSFAFEQCTALKSIRIPGSVENIEWAAFQGCSGLESIELSEGIRSLGTSAFKGCNSLKSVRFPKSMESIGNSTFYKCTGLKSLTFSEGLTYIGVGAFDMCTGLTEVTLPNSLKSIDAAAFDDCTSLADITIPESIEYLNVNAFRNTAWYNSLPDGDVYVGKIYYNYKGVAPKDPKVIIKDGTFLISRFAFDECNGLTEVVIPGSVDIIDEYAFYNCHDLKSVTIGEGLTEIGYSAFNECKSLEHIELPDTVKEIASSVFEGCESLKSAKLSKGIEYIAGNLFMDCLSLKEIIIPEGVKKIGEYAFYGCSELKNITFPKNVKEIGNFAFYNCSGLESLIIPENVETVCSYAFYGCSGLKNVIVQEGVKVIDWKAFLNCTGLTEIEIPKSADEIYRSCIGYYRNDGSDEDLKIDGLKIKGYENTSAMRYANSEGFEFVAWKEKTISAEDMYMTLTFSERAYNLENEQILKASYVNEGAAYNALSKEKGQLKKALVDISVLVDGKPVDPATEAWAELIIPEGFNPEKTVIYHITEDGKFETMESQTKKRYGFNKNDQIVFRMKKLGTYAIVDEDSGFDCSCACHKKGIVNFFFKIILFFQKISWKNKVCSCGAYHY